MTSRGHPNELSMTRNWHFRIICQNCDAARFLPLCLGTSDRPHNQRGARVGAGHGCIKHPDSLLHYQVSPSKDLSARSDMHMPNGPGVQPMLACLKRTVFFYGISRPSCQADGSANNQTQVTSPAVVLSLRGPCRLESRPQCSRRMTAPSPTVRR